MSTLRGYVVGVERGFTRVRLTGGGVCPVLTKKQYKIGEHLVLIYDEIRDLITDTYTASEWQALIDGIDLDDPGPEDDEEEEETCEIEDLDV